MSTQKEIQLLKYMKESLKLLPSIKYLDIETKNILQEFMYIDLINIIISYFQECYGCKKNYQDNEILTCQCEPKKKWCKYCYRVCVRYGRCNDCIKKPTDNYVSFGCIFDKCNNIAMYGDLKYALYCNVHSKQSVLVCHVYSCIKCVNTGIYFDTYYYCERHKTNSSMIYFKEGPYHKFEYVDTCDSCKEKCMLTYTCSCGRKRCESCTIIKMFKGKIEKPEKTRVYCNECCNVHKNNGYHFGSELTFKTCNTPDCTCFATMYDYFSGSFVCDTHKNPLNERSMIQLDERCKYNNCRALKYILSEHCIIHIKKSGEPPPCLLQ